MALALAALLVGLSLVELYLRLYAPQALYAIRYCYLGWCHVPGVSFVRGGETGEFVTHVRYNSQGLRDYEYPIEKPTGTRRVLIFGDSFAEGLEVELEDLHAKRLERLLTERFPNHKVQVLNFGVTAYDTAQEWWYFRTEGVRCQPDLVIVIWTGEAGSPFVELRNGRPVFVEPRFSRAEVWRRNVKTFLKLQFHTVSFLFDWLGANRSLHQFQEGLARRPIGVNQYHISDGTLPSRPFSPEWEAQLAIFEDFLRVAQAHGARLVVATRSSHQHRYLTESLKLHPIPGLITVDLQQVSNEEEQRFRFSKDGHYSRRARESG